MFNESLFTLYFFMSIMFMSVFRFHYFMILISIELVMLSLYGILSSTGSWTSSMDMLIVFLIMMVVAGAFGLCILINYINKWGSDYFNNYNSM